VFRVVSETSRSEICTCALACPGVSWRVLAWHLTNPPGWTKLSILDLRFTLAETPNLGQVQNRHKTGFQPQIRFKPNFARSKATVRHATSGNCLLRPGSCPGPGSCVGPYAFAYRRVPFVPVPGLTSCGGAGEVTRSAYQK
jgi:hypothetical protein